MAGWPWGTCSLTLYEDMAKQSPKTHHHHEVKHLELFPADGMGFHFILWEIPLIDWSTDVDAVLPDSTWLKCRATIGLLVDEMMALYISVDKIHFVNVFI